MPVRRGALRGRPAWLGALGLPVLCVAAVLAATVARPTPFTKEVEVAATEPRHRHRGHRHPRGRGPASRAQRAARPPRRGSDPADDPRRRRLRRLLPRQRHDDGGEPARRRGVQPRHHRVQHRPGARAGTARWTGGSSPSRRTAIASTDRWRFFLGLAKPDLVLLTLAWAGGGVEQQVDGQWRHDCDPEHDVRLREVFDRRAPGARLDRRPHRGHHDPLPRRRRTTRASGGRRRTAATTRCGPRPRPPAPRIVDLAGWACPDGQCARRARRCRPPARPPPLRRSRRRDGRRLAARSADVERLSYQS